jgi:hypothetical protein
MSRGVPETHRKNLNLVREIHLSQSVGFHVLKFKMIKIVNMEVSEFVLCEDFHNCFYLSEANNVISILISSDFLKMDTLVILFFIKSQEKYTPKKRKKKLLFLFLLQSIITYSLSSNHDRVMHYLARRDKCLESYSHNPDISVGVTPQGKNFNLGYIF